MDLKKPVVSSEITIKEALKKLDLCATKILFIIDQENHLTGSLSDGDVRRFIISGGDLDSPIDQACNHSPFAINTGTYTNEDLKHWFTKKKIDAIPVVDHNGLYKSFVTWDNVMENDDNDFLGIYNTSALVDIPVVVMAGGKGTRLKPFTDVLPKPLVPINEKPIMDWIIEEFKKYGACSFYATLNYRGKMIEAYYGSINKDYTIEFKWEKDFYGTAGSLKLLESEISSTFIVSNCDIIVKADYADVLDFHKKSEAAMTVVSSIQHLEIPYGVLDFGEGGVIKEIKEKPESTHAINTGVYILEKRCLEHIPAEEFFHITHLMERLMTSGEKVVTYPVNEKAYVDVGQLGDYMNAVESLSF